MFSRTAQIAVFFFLVEATAAGPLRRYSNVTIAEDTCTSKLHVMPSTSLQTALPLVVNGPTTLAFSFTSVIAPTATSTAGAQANADSAGGNSVASDSAKTSILFTYAPETSAAPPTSQANSNPTPSTATAIAATEGIATFTPFTYAPLSSTLASSSSIADTTSSSTGSPVETTTTARSTTLTSFLIFSNTSTAFWATAYPSGVSPHSLESSDGLTHLTLTSLTAVTTSVQTEATATAKTDGVAVTSSPSFAYPLPSTEATTMAYSTTMPLQSASDSVASLSNSASESSPASTEPPRYHDGKPTDSSGVASKGPGTGAYSAGPLGITIIPLDPSVVYITTTVTETTGKETVTVSV